jgi:competence protein ComEC
VIGGVLLLSGVLLSLCSVALPGTGWMLTAASLAMAVFASRLRRRSSLRHGALLLAGMVLAWHSTRQWIDLRVAAPSEIHVLLEGRIVSVPARDGAELRFDLEGVIVDGARSSGLSPLDMRLRTARLRWRDASPAPRAGERWRLLVRLAPAAGPRNFAGSDPARFAFRDRVHLAGRVLPSKLNSRLAAAQPSVDTLRARLAARIGEQVADPDAGALLIALAVGLTDGMSADQWRVFNATGTTHLVAISGLHVTLFALAAFVVARFLWRGLHWSWPRAGFGGREPFALLLGLGAAGAYSLLAGLSVPTQRTWLMLACVALTRLAARHAGAGRTWTLALIAVLCLDPFAPLAAGFWLSFVAVGVILAAASETPAGAATPLVRAAAVVRLQAAIMLALAPLTFAVFDSVSVAGLWVNLIAIPLVSFVLVPLVLTGVVAELMAPAMSPPCFDAAAGLYHLAWPGLTWAADSPLALWRATPGAWWFAYGLCACLVLLRRWPLALRLPAVCAALPLLFAPARPIESGTARISVLDAERGSAVLLFTRSHVLLFDTGDTWGSRGSRVREIVLPALDAHARHTVDLLVLPTLNEDRAHGAALLAFERKVSGVLVGGGWPATSLPVTTCEDSRFRWDGVVFQTFGVGTSRRYCVLRVAAGARGIVLTGDMDHAAERELISRLPRGLLESDVVLMSRQGSRAGSAPQWIEATDAAVAIAAGGIAGSRSRADTFARWRRSGAAVLDTRRDGAMELGLGTRGASVIAVARVSRYPFVWRRLL